MDGEKYSSGKRSYSHIDAGEGNERSKRRHSDFERGSAMPGDNDTVYRILCPGNKIGSVIGKGGGIIKSLRQETHAKIKIADSIPGVEERVIIIFSSPKDQRKEHDEEKNSDEEADNAAKDDIDREPLCPAQDALFKVHARIVDGEGVGGSDYEEDDKSRNVTARLLVPTNQIGCLLGKGGKIIEKMRSDTSAQIRIMSKEQLPPCAMDTDELVQISGDPTVVKKALYEISARLHENPAKQRLSYNSGSHFGNNPYGSGGPAFSSVNLIPQGNPMWSHQNVGAPIVGIGPPMPWLGGYGNEAASAWHMNSSGFPVLPNLGGPSRKDGGPGKEVTIRILSPNDRVGGVIGKSGSTINQIRQESGSRIKIAETVSESEETEIVVSASEFADDQVSPTIEALLQLQGRTTARSENEGHITTRLLVPSNQIGCLIGKAGSIISEMRKTSRADIRILSKENLPKCASQNDELVQIAGEANYARDALIQIASRLRAKVLQDGDGAGKGGPPALSSKSNLSKADGAPISSHYSARQDMLSPGRMYPSSGLGFQGTGGRSSTGGYSSFGTYQSGGSGYDPIQGYTSSRTTDSGYSGGFPKNVSTTTVEVTIPKNAVGSVLGKRGSNIQNIREISGAKVKLHDSESGSSDRVIEISGTPEQTHAAKSLLQAFIATGGQSQPTRSAGRGY